MTMPGRLSLCLELALAAGAVAVAGSWLLPADRGACVVLTGAQSAVQQARVVLVTSPEALASLWLEHRGLPSQAKYDFYFDKAGVPQVDFATHVVVAVFVGERSNTAALRLDSLETDEGVTTLRYAANSYQSGETADEAHPYGFFVLPRPDEALQVDEQLYAMTGPSRIEPRAIFEPVR